MKQLRGLYAQTFFTFRTALVNLIIHWHVHLRVYFLQYHTHTPPRPQHTQTTTPTNIHSLAQTITSALPKMTTVYLKQCKLIRSHLPPLVSQYHAAISNYTNWYDNYS
jgi:hypothetical protein